GLRTRAAIGKELPSNYADAGALIGAVVTENQPLRRPCDRLRARRQKPCAWTICRKAATSRIDAKKAVSAAAGAALAFRSAAADWASAASPRSGPSAGGPRS